ncbi:MAG: hypothetical protein PHW04_03550 [Candidatus Wallbacteria bacterium]|nr:hypothetical protein [Candidatus Wallbacteria bacterium]
MSKLLAVLLLTCLAVSCFAADTREILLKGYKFYQNQGIKNYSAVLKSEPANPLVTKTTIHWQDTGKVSYELEFTANCPDAQKQMMKDAMKETMIIPEQMTDNLLKDFNITELKEMPNAVSLTMEPKDPNSPLKKQIHVYDKSGKMIGQRIISVNPQVSSDATVKFNYLKSGNFEVLERQECRTKVKMKNPAPGATSEIETENSSVTVFSDYQINQ